MIPQGSSSARVQEIANEWCTANGNNAAYAAQPDPQQTSCYGKLVGATVDGCSLINSSIHLIIHTIHPPPSRQAIKPPAMQKNKYPGSQLKYIYNATTVYEFGGSTYKVDTQARAKEA